MSRRPNILILLADQLRRGALGAYGDKQAETPNLDRLIRGGVRMDAACATFPVCVPYRFSLMTGQYAHSRMVPAIQWRMSPTERTLADDFNEAGYETIYVGKWHLFGGSGPSRFNRPVPREYQGRWEHWYGFEFRNDFFDTTIFYNDDPTPRPLGTYQTDGLTDVTLDHLAQRKDRSRPWCCLLSVEPPHPPMEAPEELERKWLARDLEPPPNFLVPEPGVEPLTAEQRQRVERSNQIYYAMVENLDQNVGRIFKHLEESGELENTIIVVTADHGELGGAHRRQGKSVPYEESVGVPLVFYGPSCGIPSGNHSSEPTCTEDLYPTFLELAGIPARSDLPGLNLVPLIHGEVQELPRPGVLLEHVLETRPTMPNYGMPWRGFRSRQHLYTVRGSGKEGGMKPWQFYDLAADPWQLDNRVESAGALPLIKQHRQWMIERMAETGDEEWVTASHGELDYEPWLVHKARG